MRLTDAIITRERYRGEPETDEEGREKWPTCVLWDDEVQGLGVRIYPSVRGRPSRKDFIVTWRTGLKSRTMAIGTYGVDCTLRQARRTARQALDLARRGRDPIQERQLALGIGTPEDLASRFLFEHTTAAKKKAVSDAERSGDAPGGEAPEVIEPPAPTPVASPEARGTEPSTESLTAPVGAGESESAVPPAAGAASAAPASPLAAGEARGAEEQGRSPDPPPRPAAVRREAESPRRFTGGPLKARLLTIPDALYREIERRARAAGLTLTGYLQALIEREEASRPAENVVSRVEADPSFDAAKETADLVGDEQRRRDG